MEFPFPYVPYGISERCNITFIIRLAWGNLKNIEAGQQYYIRDIYTYIRQTLTTYIQDKDMTLLLVKIAHALPLINADTNINKVGKPNSIVNYYFLLGEHPGIFLTQKN